MVHPPLARLVHERQRPEAAHPLIRSRAAAAGSAARHDLLTRWPPAGSGNRLAGEDEAEAHAQREQVAHGDRPLGGHGVVEAAVDAAAAPGGRPARASSRSTGSSSRSLHSSTRIIVAAAAIGLVIEAMRKIVSRRIGSPPPTALVPIASTCTSPRRLTSVTIPGTSPRSTWPASTSCMRSSRALDHAPLSVTCASRPHWSVIRIRQPAIELGARWLDSPWERRGSVGRLEYGARHAGVR